MRIGKNYFIPIESFNDGCGKRIKINEGAYL